MRLCAARKARDQRLRLLAEGIYPQEEKADGKKASQRTFKESVDAWFAYRKETYSLERIVHASCIIDKLPTQKQ